MKTLYVQCYTDNYKILLILREFITSLEEVIPGRNNVDKRDYFLFMCRKQVHDDRRKGVIKLSDQGDPGWLSC